MVATSVHGAHKPAPGEREPLVAYPFAFSNEANVTQKVKDECNFEKRLNNSIRDQSKRRGAKIEFASTVEEFERAERKLVVTIDDVNAHEWSARNLVMPGINPGPSSVVTFDVKIVIDGQVVKQVKKRMRSRVAFGSCSRIEKIATSGGAFIAEWVVRQTY